MPLISDHHDQIYDQIYDQINQIYDQIYDQINLVEIVQIFGLPKIETRARIESRKIWVGFEGRVD
jgi:hypothetical protein